MSLPQLLRRPRLEQVRADFDELAQLVPPGASGMERYDRFLRSLIPNHACRVLEVGSGLGRFAATIATGTRQVLGIDLSPVMIARAQTLAPSSNVSFVCGDFLSLDFGGDRFDCIVTAATLHHMSEEAAIQRMKDLLLPGGRLIVHDMKRDVTIADALRARTALAHTMLMRVIQTSRPFQSRPVRRLWSRHCANEEYLSIDEARVLARRLLPGATVIDHWMWRYSIVWDKPDAVRAGA